LKVYNKKAWLTSYQKHHLYNEFEFEFEFVYLHTTTPATDKRLNIPYKEESADI